MRPKGRSQGARAGAFSPERFDKRGANRPRGTNYERGSACGKARQHQTTFQDQSLVESTNLLFLLFIAFLPFPTEVLGEYMLDEANQTTAVTFYASSLLLTAASWLLIWLYATWGHRLIDRHLDSGYLRRMTLQYVGTVALYSSAVLVSPFNSKWGLGICVGLTSCTCFRRKARPTFVRSTNKQTRGQD